MRHPWALCWCLLAAAVGHAAPYDAGSAAAHAAPSPITDHFAISGGYFLGHVSTDGRFDSATGVHGTPFSAESDLGLTSQARQLSMELMLRMRERSRLRVDYFDISRRATRQLDRTIKYGTQTFQIDDVVQSQLDWRQVSIDYSYSIFRTDRYELGLGVGLLLLQAEAFGNVPARQGVHEDFTGAGPMITPEIDGTWRLWRRFAFSGRAQYMHVLINGIGGTLADYHAELQYRWQPNLAVGLGYGTERIDLEVTHRDPSGVLHMDIRGPELFLRASF